MPILNPTAGRAFIWLVSCFILISLILGGAFLVKYMIIPDTDPMFLYIGMGLICLPWSFWIITCVYRLISRSFGVRLVCCGGMEGSTVSSRRGGGGGNAATVVPNNAGEAKTPRTPHGTNTDVGFPDGQRHVHFGEAIVVHENDQISSQDGADFSRNSSMNDASYRSHESEVPLASSMAH